MIEVSELNTQHQHIYKDKKGSNIQKLVTSSCLANALLKEKGIEYIVESILHSPHCLWLVKSAL